MCSDILLAGIRSPVMGEIKNCSLAAGAAAVGLGAEMKLTVNKACALNAYTQIHDMLCSCQYYACMQPLYY